MSITKGCAVSYVFIKSKKPAPVVAVVNPSVAASIGYASNVIVVGSCGVNFTSLPPDNVAITSKSLSPISISTVSVILANFTSVPACAAIPTKATSLHVSGILFYILLFNFVFL